MWLLVPPSVRQGHSEIPPAAQTLALLTVGKRLRGVSISPPTVTHQPLLRTDAAPPVIRRRRRWCLHAPHVRGAPRKSVRCLSSVSSREQMPCGAAGRPSVAVAAVQHHAHSPVSPFAPPPVPHRPASDDSLRAAIRHHPSCAALTAFHCLLSPAICDAAVCCLLLPSAFSFSALCARHRTV